MNHPEHQGPKPAQRINPRCRNGIDPGQWRASRRALVEKHP
ncbi:MAG: hypothetical protein ACRYGK_15350 [Janthinobacterium lividum]